MDTGFLMEEWWAPILMMRQAIIIFGGENKCIVDAAGSAVVEYGYDAWGKVLCTKGSKAEGVGKDNLFRYRGYAYDEETPGMGTVFEYGSSVGKKRRIVEPQFIHILQKFTLISILGYKIELRKYDYGCRYADFSHIRGSEPNTCRSSRAGLIFSPRTWG